MTTANVTRRLAGVPDWACDAVWYQVFPERFRNGQPDNDPTPADTHDRIPDWAVSRWGMDWYGQAPWEIARGDFHRSVFHRRFGGDLAGVREKLPYLQELGVNALYLNPIFHAPSLHKYDASSLHHVDPTLGPDRDGDRRLLAGAGETEDPRTWVWTAADRAFLDLVAEIHRRGMRVILDGVFNHTGRHFFAFQDLLQHGRRSRYRDWYRIEQWHDDTRFEYQGWFGVKDLPELGRDGDNLAAPVRQYLFDITRRWMAPTPDGRSANGIDGWRLDVAFCVPHRFWKEWRAVVKGLNPEAYTTGEIVGLAADYLAGDELDAVMNYVWLYTALGFFTPHAAPLGLPEFQRRMNELADAYAEDTGYVVQNLLDSHDTGRVLTMLENRCPPFADWDAYFNYARVTANNRLVTTRPGPHALAALRQLAIFQMTSPGAPMIYYGTEVGMWGANDPDNRQPMLWDDIAYDDEAHDPRGACPASPRGPDKDLFAFYQRAIALRAEHRALRRGARRWVQTAHPRLLAYTRQDEREEILVLLNAGDTPTEFELKGAARDLWTPRREVPAGRITIDPRGWRLFQRR